MKTLYHIFGEDGAGARHYLCGTGTPDKYTAGRDNSVEGAAGWESLEDATRACKALVEENGKTLTVEERQYPDEQAEGFVLAGTREERLFAKEHARSIETETVAERAAEEARWLAGLSPDERRELLKAKLRAKLKAKGRK